MQSEMAAFILLRPPPSNRILTEAFNGMSNISLSSTFEYYKEFTDVTFQMNGNILRIEKIEGIWEPACYTPTFFIFYTCNGNQCKTMVEVNNCD